MSWSAPRSVCGAVDLTDNRHSAGPDASLVKNGCRWSRTLAQNASPSTRPSPPIRAAAASTAGVAPASEIELLDEGYRFLRRIELRLRVVNDQPIHRLPEARDELDKLARRSGFPDGATLKEHVERWQTEIRGAYRRLLGA